MKKIYRFIAVFTVINLVVEIFFPAVSYALTSGPSQPEHVQFSPAGASDMVNLFTGDFSYNIPLFELPGPDGGYPFNLTYQAGISPEQEASWVGLGWNITPGAINRQMRGLPDEFKGDMITQEVDKLPVKEVGIKASAKASGEHFEVFGIDIMRYIPRNRLSVNMRLNNYTGIGFSIDEDLTVSKAFPIKITENFLSTLTISAGDTYTFDSESGATRTRGVGINFSGGKAGGEGNIAHGLELGFNYQRTKNSRLGLLSETYSTNIGTNIGLPVGVGIKGGWTLNLANAGYMPSISIPNKVSTTSFRGQGGKSVEGAYNRSLTAMLTLSEQKFRYPIRSIPAYGYNQSHSATDRGMLDFNREKDGVIDKETKAMPTPNFTYDTYLVTGQGIGGVFRPFRGEVGMLGDNRSESITTSFGLGADVSIGTHIGVNLQETSGSSESYRKPIKNYTFSKKKTGNATYEPVYYKFTGEASIKPITGLEKIGNHLPMRFDLDNKGNPINLVYSKVLSDLEESSDIATGTTATATTDATSTKTAYLDNYFNENERDSRNTAIQSVENQYASVLSEYHVEYTEKNSTDKKILAREANTETEENSHLKPHHLAGFTCTNTSGTRYVYALPAYNYTQVEQVFSVKKQNITTGDKSNIGRIDNIDLTASGDDYKYKYSETEQYKNKTTVPDYPYAYLMTSILGTDYIDVDPTENPGPSDKDLGYWVKFNYERTSDQYKWRAPYKGVNFTEGIRNTEADDKASFAYGRKDLWYVKSVETKSHIAIFELQDRSDALGVSNPYTSSKDISNKQQKLKSISIYTKQEYYANGTNSTPIKKVVFDYGEQDNTPSLCRGVPNASSSLGGKLTLRKLWFEHQGITRGSSTPYIFKYHGEDTDYKAESQDKWGIFSPRTTGEKSHTEYPYVDQNLSQATQDDYVSAWSLKEITMPTGSKMQVTYEADDYAYVQDKQAMQMRPFLTRMEDVGQEKGQVGSDLRIFFPLDENIEIYTLGQGEEGRKNRAAVVNKYLDDKDQVYFRTVVSLRDDKDYEDMTAFLDIEAAVNTEGEYTRSLYHDDATDKTYGYFTLKPSKVNNGDKYHPITMASWIKLKQEFPRLVIERNRMEDGLGGDWSSVEDIFRNLGKRLSAFATIRELWKSYFEIADKKDFGKKIKLEKSYVRLNNIKGKKYGGGHRVKEIKFWDGNGLPYSVENTYGQTYEYTLKEEGGISSGVACYEPLSGGDENALHYAEKYIKDIPGGVPGLTGYGLFIEYPVNEGYYPGAKVGYSEVTIKSLATQGKINRENSEFPQNVDYGTTGVTVNKFYTTRDFPTIVSQTEVVATDKKDTEFLRFPISVTKTKEYAGMSQGFVVELNNMDGVPKSMHHYGQNEAGEVQYDKAVSSSEYTYKTKTRGKRTVLDNVCKVLVGEKNGVIKKEDRLVGVDYEVFIDSRYSETRTKTQGGDLNVNFPSWAAGLPIPLVFFSSDESYRQVRTTVVNKVIYRSAILESVRVSDGLSITSTKNLLWDANTGGVLLTEVNNNFDNKIYSYTIPAYTQYDDMGAAYRNMGMEFTADIQPQDGGRMYNAVSTTTNKDWIKELVAGDELIVSSGTSQVKTHKAIFMGINSTTKQLEFYIIPQAEVTLPFGNLSFMVYRSGRRNLLGASAGSITSLKDPTEEPNRTQKTFSGKSTITKKNEE